MFGFTSNYIKVKTSYNPLIINQTAMVKMTELNNDGTMKINYADQRQESKFLAEVI